MDDETQSEPTETEPVQTGTPDSVEARRERMKRRQSKEGDGQGGKGETVAIGDEQMRNLPRPCEIHGLSLILKALPSGSETAHFQTLLNQWPDTILLCAFTKPPPGGGVDYEATARDYSARNNEKDAKVRPEEIADDLGRLWLLLPAYRTIFAQTLFCMAKETPGLTEETLGEQLGNLTLPVQYVDLARVLWRVLGGFPGDMAARF